MEYTEYREQPQISQLVPRFQLNGHQGRVSLKSYDCNEYNTNLIEGMYLFEKIDFFVEKG